MDERKKTYDPWNMYISYFNLGITISHLKRIQKMKLNITYHISLLTEHKI